MELTVVPRHEKLLVMTGGQALLMSAFWHKEVVEVAVERDRRKLVVQLSPLSQLRSLHQLMLSRMAHQHVDTGPSCDATLMRLALHLCQVCQDQ